MFHLAWLLGVKILDCDNCFKNLLFAMILTAFIFPAFEKLCFLIRHYTKYCLWRIVMTLKRENCFWKPFNRSTKLDICHKILFLVYINVRYFCNWIDAQAQDLPQCWCCVIFKMIEVNLDVTGHCFQGCLTCWEESGVINETCVLECQ